jgi:hypothetical protein
MPPARATEWNVYIASYTKQPSLSYKNNHIKIKNCVKNKGGEEETKYMRIY